MAKSAQLKAKIGGIVEELNIKTNAENILLTDGTLLSDKLLEIVSAVNLRAKTTDMNTAITTAINDLIAGAPAAYDTLKEIADYLANDSTATSALTAAIANKVDKESGKGLSANDFTTALLNKLNGIAASANNYIHPSYTARTAALYKITVDGTGHISAVTAATKADIIALGIVDGGTIDTAMSTTSANAVQNKVVTAAIAKKGTVYYSATQPAGLAENDLWVQILE